MYYCNDCNEFINPTYPKGQCPYCDSEDLEKAGTCSICGTDIKSSEDYCKDCLEMAEKCINNFTEKLDVARSLSKDLLLAIMEKEN